MANDQNAVQRLWENPAFYGIGMIVGLIGWFFGYLEDGHIILVLVAGAVGLARYFRARAAAGDASRGSSD
jgi:hypothetical protein